MSFDPEEAGERDGSREERGEEEAWRRVAALQLALAATHYPVVIGGSFRTENGWETGTSDDELSLGKQEIVRGAYRWEARALDSFSWWSCPEMDAVSDFYLTVQTRQVNGPADGECGVIFRANGDDAYGFSLRGDGQCTAYRDYGDEHKTLLEWHPTLACAGQVNRLTVVGSNSRFVLLVNDQYVGEFADDALPEGKVGLTIGLSHEDDTATFEFSHFELRAP